MKVNMIKLAGGAMLPADEVAEEQLRKIKNAECYSVNITPNANYKLLQKIHVFFKYCAQFYYSDSEVTNEQIDLVRRKLTMAAGYYKQIFLADGVRFELIPVSISFAKMSEDEHGVFYNKIVNVALKNVFHTADDETFNQLMSFF